MRTILLEPKTQADVIGITDTWFQSKHTNNFIEILRYHEPPKCKDTTRAEHGGILTYIDKNVDYIRRTDLEVGNIETI